MTQTADRDVHLASPARQYLLQPVHRDFRGLPGPLSNERPVRLQHPLAIAPPSSLVQPSLSHANGAPISRHCDTHPKARRCGPTALTCHDGARHTRSRWSFEEVAS